MGPAWLLIKNRPAGGRDLPGSGQQPRSPHAEEEPADVGEEGDPAAVAEALNSPKLASMSWHEYVTLLRSRRGCEMRVATAGRGQAG
jgi:hypothetical protein